MNSDIHPYGLGDNSGRGAKHLARNNSSQLHNPITGNPYQKPSHATSQHHLDNLGLHGDWKITNNYNRYKNKEDLINRYKSNS
jgi:hypothetical protein